MSVSKRSISFVFVCGLFFTFYCFAQDLEWELINSNIGVGTGSPQAKLHVAGVTDAKLLIENTGVLSGFNTKVMFNMINDGGIRFDMLDRSTGNNWVFQNQFGAFDITLAGTGVREFRFNPNGNLEISGTLISASSREVKSNIEAIDQKTVLERILALPISEWSYDAELEVRHIGPMAEDFYNSFGLGNSNTGLSAVDIGGVSLAAIQGLKYEKDAEIERLKVENENLRLLFIEKQAQQDKRIEQLEVALFDLLKK